MLTVVPIRVKNAVVSGDGKLKFLLFFSPIGLKIGLNQDALYFALASRPPML